MILQAIREVWPALTLAACFTLALACPSNQPGPPSNEGPPDANVVSCGGSGEACCDGGICTTAGLQCEPAVYLGSPGLYSYRCISCGAKDQQCCPGVAEGDSCTGATVCLSNTCTACGDVGQPCCPEHGTCTTPTCSTCTAPLSLCFPGSVTGVPLPSGVPLCIGAELSDPDIRPGFPAPVEGGWAAVVLDDIDGVPGPEILLSSSDGLFHAFKSDGGYAPGWPTSWSAESGASLFSTGRASEYLAARSIFAVQYLESGALQLIGLGGDGRKLSGWPRAYEGATLPAVGPVGSGDWLFSCGTYSVYAYRVDSVASGPGVCGSFPLGWPVSPPGTGQLAGLAGTSYPAMADLDGDGTPEVVVIGGAFEPCGSTVWCRALWAIRSDGSLVPGLDPLLLPGVVNGDNMVALGDVEGDGGVEIVSPPANDNTFGGNFRIPIVSARGQIVRTLEIVPTTADTFASPPVLADMDGDGVPEVIVQLDNSLHVFTRTGELPGFPVIFNTDPVTGPMVVTLGNSIPVVGDIDGDGSPDIVLMVGILSTPLGDLHAFHSDGTELAGFPKRLVLGPGAVSAIADLDGVGVNQLVARGPYDVWVFDVSHGAATGRVEWGQLGGGPGHEFTYRAAGGASTGGGTPASPSCADIDGGACSPPCGAGETCLAQDGGAPTCKPCGGPSQPCCANCGCSAPAACMRQLGNASGCCYPCGCKDNGQSCAQASDCCSNLCTPSGVCGCAPPGSVFPAPLGPDRVPCCALSWRTDGCAATCL